MPHRICICKQGDISNGLTRICSICCGPESVVSLAQTQYFSCSDLSKQFWEGWKYLASMLSIIFHSVVDDSVGFYAPTSSDSSALSCRSLLGSSSDALKQRQTVFCSTVTTIRRPNNGHEKSIRTHCLHRVAGAFYQDLQGVKCDNKNPTNQRSNPTNLWDFSRIWQELMKCWWSIKKIDEI